jgi:hypothetical protein
MEGYFDEESGNGILLQSRPQLPPHLTGDDVVRASASPVPGTVASKPTVFFFPARYGEARHIHAVSRYLPIRRLLQYLSTKVDFSFQMP